MATFTGRMTLAELVKREDPNGQAAELVDAISQVNAILEDTMMIECNNGNFHQATRVAEEPSGTTRAYNAGISPTVGVTEVITEPVAMIDNLWQADEALMLHSANPAKERLDEEELHIKGMAKQFASIIFDGNRDTDPNTIQGINNRDDYKNLGTGYVYDNAKGDASATANKSSIYVIQHGKKRFTLLHPRNDPGTGGSYGIKKKDMGIDLVADSIATTKVYPAVRTWFELHFGMFIYDARMVKRMCNISTTNIDGVDDFSWDEEIMFDMLGDLEDNGDGAVIYCNKTILAQIRKRSNVKGNGYFTESKGEGPFARPVLFFDGIPIHRVDQITNVQAQVTT